MKKILNKKINNEIYQVIIDEGMDSIINFMDYFGETVDKPSQLKIYIENSEHNNIKLSKDLKTIRIGGYAIEDMENPYNYIGLTQAVTRFIALHSSKKGKYLLHASASLLKNKGIVFGDDGSSEAKSLASLIIAFETSGFIVDEFCFLDESSMKITSIGKIPLHVRDVVKKTLNDMGYLNNIENHDFNDTDAGIFTFNVKNIKMVNNVPIGPICFIHFSDSNKISEILGEEKIEALSYCLTSHIAKLINPNLDRMSFTSNTDSKEFKKFGKKERDRIINKLNLTKNIERLAKKVHCYRVDIIGPENLYVLIRDL